MKKKNKLQQIWDTFDGLNRSKASGILDWEAAELENVFSLLTLGAFVGMPSPPLQITFDLLPDMESELQSMVQKSGTAGAPLSQLFSQLEIV